MAKPVNPLAGKPRAGDNNHRPPSTDPWASWDASLACDIGGANAAVIIAAIGTAVAANVLLTIGGAQGGRGYLVSVYSGGQSHKRYATDNLELEEVLRVMIEFYRSPSEDPYELYRIRGAS